MEQTSDLQFVAQMLLKSHAQDQITVAEHTRLEDIAENGRTTGKKPARNTMEIVDPAHAGATRVERTTA